MYLVRASCRPDASGCLTLVKPKIPFATPDQKDSLQWYVQLHPETDLTVDPQVSDQTVDFLLNCALLVLPPNGAAPSSIEYSEHYSTYFQPKKKKKKRIRNSIISRWRRLLL